ncbi:MAG: hypothetical protein HKN76_20840 [Saprospiraceae bacterium]|nr:hypothetical protein [Saprospiraceae bacterium]
MKAVRYIIFFAFGVLAIEMHSQGDALLHLDRPHYLPGQIIYYSISSNYNLPDTCVLGVTLVHDAKKIDLHYLLWLKGYASGCFQLPFDIPGGIYSLQADVYMRKSGEKVNIINAPFTVLSGSISTAESPAVVTFDAPQENTTIKIHWDGTARVRDILPCTVKIENGQINDPVSISIKEKNFYGHTSVHRQSFYLSDESLLQMIPIKGKRTFLNNKPREDAFLFITNPADLSFSFNWVDADGDFYVRFPLFYSKTGLFFVDNGGNDIDVSLSPPLVLNPGSTNVVASPGAKRSIISYNERKKIYELFSGLEETVVTEEVSQVAVPIPDYVVDVQDFSVRGKLVDLLKEITTPLKFRKLKSDTYTAKILREVLDLKYFYDSDPLFFINGIATRDFNYLANLPLQDLKSLEIYASLQTIRSLKLVDIGGVVAIETMDPLFSIPEEIRLPGIEVQGLQIPIRYPVTVNTSSPGPQIKSLLFWQPNGKLDTNGTYVFDLPCSDDLSTFVIEVVHHPSQTVNHTEIKIEYHD